MSLTIDAYGANAKPAWNPAVMDCGNLIAEVPAQMELAALAQNKTVAIAKIPAGSYVVGLLEAHDALGANTGLKVGIQSDDGTVSDDDFFATVADTSTASRGAYSCLMPFLTTRDCYVVVTQSGSGTATGTLSAIPLYVFQNLAT